MRQGKTTVMASSVRNRAAAVMVAGLLSASCVGAPAAFASEVSPIAGAQIGTGTTDVSIQLKTAGDEVGGGGSESNPDANNDGYGDNIAFSVPMSINFIVDSTGKLTGPTAVIQNLSKFPIQVSSLEINAASNWNIVPDASKATESNAIDFQIGPEGNMLDASSYLTKNWVSAPAKWNIEPNEGSLVLKSAGDVNNVTSNIAVRTKVATMHWYVRPSGVL